MVFGLDDDKVAFPDPKYAEPDGLLAVGGKLSFEWLLTAYYYGIFPWFSVDQKPYWFSLDPRMVLKIDDFRYSKSLRRVVESGRFEVRIDTNFEAVIRACSTTPREGEDGTWITQDFLDGYIDLHRRGFAHSFETYYDGALVGGLYGVSVHDVFSGESMFHTMTDASKVAFVRLVEWCRCHGFRFIDAQQPSDHLASLGARPIPRDEFSQLMSSLKLDETIVGRWPSHYAVLLIGGNQGDRVALLEEACSKIHTRIGSIAKVSKVYETEPWGFEADQNFLNMALLVDTDLDPEAVLHTALDIEAELGRVRLGHGYASRPMDIDVILYDHQVLNSPDLIVPHPRMQHRRFVLQPLADIIPWYRHPVLRKSITDLLAECSDPCEVRTFSISSKSNTEE